MIRPRSILIFVGLFFLAGCFEPKTCFDGSFCSTAGANLGFYFRKNCTMNRIEMDVIEGPFTYRVSDKRIITQTGSEFEMLGSTKIVEVKNPNSVFESGYCSH